MNRNFPAHQAEAMTQPYSNRIVSNKRRSEASSSSSEIPTQSTEEDKVNILKDINNTSDTPSHIRHINIPNELLDPMEE